jgi:nitrogen fixation NifU-like protein|tara:strand:- start:588 stop:995 length:408 start_codon:yes stop_codon:yes gene_type:complete
MISPEIIKIASDTSNYGIKKNSNLIATSKNKICGDKITIGIQTLNNKIEKMSYETESCIFCQASASLLSKIIKKSNIENLRTDIDQIIMFHKNKKIILKKKYKPFRKLFQKKYKERFNCIILPFNGLSKAINNIT